MSRLHLLFEKIYLIDTGDNNVVWCDVPDPSDGVDPADVEEYVLASTHSQLKQELEEAKFDLHVYQYPPNDIKAKAEALDKAFEIFWPKCDHRRLDMGNWKCYHSDNLRNRCRQDGCPGFIPAINKATGE